MGKVVDAKQTRTAIADNLQRLLRERGWSQADLARKIFDDVEMAQRVQVNRWVLGKSAPSAADLLNLAEAFGVSAEEIGRQKKSRKSA